MATRATVRRNTAVIAEAKAKGRPVRFTYTTAAGVTARRTVVPSTLEPTRHNPDALVLRGKDGLNDRSFRTDRVTRAVIL